MRHRNRLVVVLGLIGLCWLATCAGAAEVTPPVPSTAPTTEPTMATLSRNQLDPAAFTQWVDGAEAPVIAKRGPSHVIFTHEEGAEWNGMRFGEGKTPGPRYLRIGFTEPVHAESILVRAGGQLSVLKPDATYPGNVADESQWIVATRLDRDQVTSAEVGEHQYGIWVLPPGTQTRAIRFTHVPQPTDNVYFGWLGGVEILPERCANIAPQATASSQLNDIAAHRLIDGNENGWQAWDDGAEGAPEVVSPEHPQWVMLNWRKPVRLDGLIALWAAFSEADVQVFTGSDLRNSGEGDWKTIGHYTHLTNQYPRQLSPNTLDFGSTVTTSAVRLRITKATEETHPHLQGKTKAGKRIWLGELVALHPLEAESLATAVLPGEDKRAAVHPPIPVRFTLPQAGFVTLVVEDAATGMRVRNLISETHFEAGPQTVWWDGLDDLDRDVEAARHGIYHIPGKFVAPGTYRVRGLYRGPIDLKYEFAIYNAGSPAWETADNTGAWLANHTPPHSALFVPADRAPGGKPLVYLGSYVTEGGHGLAWVDLDGCKQGGRGWIGGAWTGAPYLARDIGDKPAPDVSVYVGAAWEGELRLTAMTSKGDKPVVKYHFANDKESSVLGGIAVRNGLMAASLTKENRLLLIDAPANKILGNPSIDDPRGVAFDSAGRLLVLSNHQLLRFELGTPASDMKLPKPVVVVADGLLDPQQLTLDKAGLIYISDRGTSHQVKVFSADGKLVRTIGHPGEPGAGPYDPSHMNNPNGLTIDSEDRLWVAETDFQPKRVSVWTLDGKLVRAFYGPSEYGGGGTLDPNDKSRFYFHGMRFKLDWEKATSDLQAVYWRPTPRHEPAKDDGLQMPTGNSDGLPESPIIHDGKQYFSNTYNSNPTVGASTAFIWLEQNDVAHPVAGMGHVRDWKLLSQDAFKSRWPAGVNFAKELEQNHMMFLWSDVNHDGQVQPDEVTILPAVLGGVTVGADLSFVASRVDQRILQYVPTRITSEGVPVYAPDAPKVLLEGAQSPTSSGGDQAILAEDGALFVTVAPKPFAPQGIGGGHDGKATWSYPSLWPGLHASHESPPPQYPGEIEGTTRLLGPFIHPAGEGGDICGVNGNNGNIYLFTSDGLFIATLFKDMRVGQSWSMPMATRGMLLNELTLHDENFWPALTKTPDGNVYLVDGGRSSLVKVEGLPSIRRIGPIDLTITDAQLREAHGLVLQQEVDRQKNLGPQTLTVVMRHNAPTIDGKLDDWPAEGWVAVDQRGVAAYFNSKSRPYDVQAAVALTGDKLYAAFRTGEKDLLTNSGEVPNAPFKTGGALDLMIGCDPGANPTRQHAVAGDVRLLVTRVGKKVRALIYRPVANQGAKEPGEPVPFSSPWRTITMDRVDDVSSAVELAGEDGNFEFSISLKALGLKPTANMTIRGDVGILRGNGFQTTQRAYWNNKATAIVSDVPSEAELTPALWGKWVFKSE